MSTNPTVEALRQTMVKKQQDQFDATVARWNNSLHPSGDGSANVCYKIEIPPAENGVYTPLRGLQGTVWIGGPYKAEIAYLISHCMGRDMDHRAFIHEDGEYSDYTRRNNIDWNIDWAVNKLGVRAWNAIVNAAASRTTADDAADDEIRRARSRGEDAHLNIRTYRPRDEAAVMRKDDGMDWAHVFSQHNIRYPQQIVDWANNPSQFGQNMPALYPVSDQE